MDDSISDSESIASRTELFSRPHWFILSNDSEWGVALDETKFRHPRVLLAYFRFVCFHNELASEDEHILIPKIPKAVSEFILSHVSIRETPEEFKEEVEALRFYVSFFSDC